MDEASEHERTRVRSRNLSTDKTKEREKREMIERGVWFQEQKEEISLYQTGVICRNTVLV